MTTEAETDEEDELARARFERTYFVSRLLNYGDDIFEGEISPEDGAALAEYLKTGQMRRDIRQSMKPLARFVVACSTAQEHLVTAVAMTLNNADPKRIRAAVGKLPAMRLLEVLDKTLPSTPYFAVLKKKATRLFQNRNTAAHGTIVTMRLVDGKPQYGRWIRSSDDTYTNIGGHTLRTWRRESTALSAAFVAIVVLASQKLSVSANLTFADLAYEVAERALLVNPEGCAWLGEILLDWFPTETGALVDLIESDSDPSEDSPPAEP